MSYAVFAALAFVGAVVLFLIFFWYCYLVVTSLYRSWLAGRIKKWSIKYWASIPALLIGYFVDLISNYTIARIVFGEWPNGNLELVTTRLTRYKNGPDCRNKAIATWVCEEFLDEFDPTGSHCHDAIRT